jgi:hypothetical protein
MGNATCPAFQCPLGSELHTFASENRPSVACRPSCFLPQASHGCLASLSRRTAVEDPVGSPGSRVVGYGKSVRPYGAGDDGPTPSGNGRVISGKPGAWFYTGGVRWWSCPRVFLVALVIDTPNASTILAPRPVVAAVPSGLFLVGSSGWKSFPSGREVQ